MTPPKKRMRLPPPAAKDDGGGEHSKPMTAADPQLPATHLAPDVNLQSIDSLMEDVINKVENINENDNTDSLQPIEEALLSLKGWQRNLFSELLGSTKALEEKERAKEKEQRALAALSYERAYLEQEIEACRSYSTPHLEKLAREEVTDDDKTTEEVLFSFLQADVKDPSQRGHIIARLHQELTLRGGLERDLKLKEKELLEVNDKLKEKTKILDGLPDQLASMERASLPLQQFVISRSKSTSLRMTGSERRNRLELAQSLPVPLYSLFQQLQQHLDLAKYNDDISITVTSETDNKQVLLQFPIPDVTCTSTNGRIKRVVIHFQYYPDHQIVTAVASGGNTTLYQDVLLDELFPHDAPEQVPSTTGRPYHWCNYLAGIYRAESVPDCKQTSTKVIVRELRRRIRANATLKHILPSLIKKAIPVPPSFDKPPAKIACKLVSFALDRKDGTDNTKDRRFLSKTYTVTCRKGAASLVTKVRLHPSRYPAVPPTWTLDPAAENDPNPLYDDRLAQLEHLVNIKMLAHVAQKAENNRDESYCDWILVHQLREIMRQWDSWLEDDSSDCKRTRKGRDRVPANTLLDNEN